MNKTISLVNETKLTFGELAVANSSGTSYIMTLLLEKKLNTEDVSEKLFGLKNPFGASVMDICFVINKFSRYGKIPVEKMTEAQVENDERQKMFYCFWKYNSGP